MFEVTGLGFNPQGDSVEDGKRDAGWRWMALERVELMQFTSLRDKNGVEIYEGDIVRGLHTYNLTIVWHKYGWGTTHIDNDGDKNIDPFDNALFEEYDIEVIGNIYSNPNLLPS